MRHGSTGAGDLILLEDQDRSQWDLRIIEQGNMFLHRALTRMQPGPYQVQAAIAAQHANARTADDTDWPTIVALYQQLSAMTGSPVVALNHAVAVGMADGPNAGLALIDGVDRSRGLPPATRREGRVVGPCRGRHGGRRRVPPGH